MCKSPRYFGGYITDNMKNDGIPKSNLYLCIIVGGFSFISVMLTIRYYGHKMKTTLADWI